MQSTVVDVQNGLPCLVDHRLSDRTGGSDDRLLPCSQFRAPVPSSGCPHRTDKSVGVANVPHHAEPVVDDGNGSSNGCEAKVEGGRFALCDQCSG